jgi:transposase
MPYLSDLTEEEFNTIKEMLPVKKVTRPRKHSLYSIFNAMLYVLISGCQWRLLPKDMPNWKTVYHYYSTWSKEEIFDEMLKKTLKKTDYNKVKINIQLYSLQTPKVLRTQIYKENLK